MRWLGLVGFVVMIVCLSCGKEIPRPKTVPPAKDTLGSGWKRITPFTTLQFNDIFFVNNTGYTMSYTIILKSTDGGETWNKLTPKIINFLNMGMGSENNAVFVCFPNKVMSTHNGGASFDTVSLADSYLMDVFFVSANVAYLAGNNIWKTTDGGITWTKLYQFSVPEGYKSLYFLNEQTGWVVREDGVYKTTDGGASWQRTPTAAFFDFRGASCLAFPNQSSGFFSDNEYIARTNNSGGSWDTVFHATHTYHDVDFPAAATGYFTDNKIIYKTSDGGNTWGKDVVLGDGSIVEIHFTDPNHGWACGNNGTILRYLR